MIEYVTLNSLSEKKPLKRNLRNKTLKVFRKQMRTIQIIEAELLYKLIQSHYTKRIVLLWLQKS